MQGKWGIREDLLSYKGGLDQLGGRLGGGNRGRRAWVSCLKHFLPDHEVQLANLTFHSLVGGVDLQGGSVAQGELHYLNCWLGPGLDGRHQDDPKANRTRGSVSRTCGNR